MTLAVTKTELNQRALDMGFSASQMTSATVRAAVWANIIEERRLDEGVRQHEVNDAKWMMQIVQQTRVGDAETSIASKLPVPTATAPA